MSGKMNRRAFIAAAAICGMARALEVDSDDAIRGILKQRIDVEKRSVGMAVCVVTPERKRIVTWGRERLGDNRPVTSETLFEIGSITRIFTALLLADMVRRGDIGLDDPVSRHLPGDFRLPLRDGHEITLADLATHTSGLPRWPLPPSDVPPSQAEIDAAMRISLGDFKVWLANVHPQNPPSAGGWWYSNAGYALLALAMAYRGGKPYEALLQARIIDPIGLRDTTYHPTAAMASHLAEGHDAALKSLPPTDVGIYIGAGGLHSTPRDLARFAAAILGSSFTIAQDNQRLLTVRRAAPCGSAECRRWAGKC